MCVIKLIYKIKLYLLKIKNKVKYIRKDKRITVHT